MKKTNPKSKLSDVTIWTHKPIALTDDQRSIPVQVFREGEIVYVNFPLNWTADDGAEGGVSIALARDHVLPHVVDG